MAAPRPACWLRVRIIEELASACTTAASLITGTDLSSRPIVAGGSDEIKADVLPDLASGVHQSAFALTEPGAGSDVARLATRYVRTRRRRRADPAKRSSSPAPVADMLVVVARLEDGPAGARGLSAFLVPRASPGVQVSATVPKAGWNGVPIAMVRLRRRRHWCRPVAGHRRAGHGPGARHLAARAHWPRGHCPGPGTRGAADCHPVRRPTRGVWARGGRAPGHPVDGGRHGRAHRGRTLHGLQRRSALRRG
jgi:alkylation response protein AidB-like acyl-CoA dehydrogenase